MQLSKRPVIRACCVLPALSAPLYVCLCLSAVFIGCDNAKPVVDNGSASADAKVKERLGEGPSSSEPGGEWSTTATPPVLDDGAVNDEGLIVLQGSDVEAASAPTPNPTPDEDLKEVAPAVSAGSKDGDTIASLPPSSPSVADGPVADEPSIKDPATEEPLPATPVSAASLMADTSGSERSDAVDKRPVEANVATEAERNQQIAVDWPQPQAVIFVSGQQHGYLEPCGCTGLDKQKGGLIRRDTLLTELSERGWEVVPVDVGNQVSRIGRQAVIKFQKTVESFKLMNYRAATLGVDDLKLSSVELIQAASSDELNPGAFISANVSIIDPSFFPGYRIVEAGGRKIGITAAMGKAFRKEINSDDVEIADPVESLKPVVQELQNQGCDFLVLLAHASLEESASIAQEVPGFDLVVTAGGFGEPTLFPEKIEGSKAVMVQVGTKGMYGGIVGLFDDAEEPIRYQKIAISSQFKDSQRMLDIFASYQERLKSVGFAGLGATPNPHPTGRKFVGAEACGDCHTTAYDIWKESPHVHATESIVTPNNDRGGIPRHHDPECVSCHVTGWNPKLYYPYESGFINPEETDWLTGSGCENCHGPGKDHVDAEYGDVEVDNDTLLKLREQMVIKLDRAQEKCMDCHDLDNSPDFHVEGAFAEYWERVKHYGKD